MREKIIKAIIILLVGVCAAYSIACHFLEFLGRTRIEKLIIMGLLVPAFIICAFFVIQKWSDVFRRTLKFAPWKILMGTSVFLAIGLFILLPYRTPTFPTQHDLVIENAAERNKLSNGESVHLSNIQIIYWPSGETRTVNRKEVKLEGNWKNENENLVADGSDRSVFSFEDDFQGWAKIVFVTSPDSGMVDVTWDGDRFRIDLYSQKTGYYEVELRQAIPWKTINRWWKFLVGLLLIVDCGWVSMALFGLLWIGLFFARQLKKLSLENNLGSGVEINFVIFTLVALICIEFLKYPIFEGVRLLRSNTFSTMVPAFTVQKSRPEVAVGGLMVDFYEDSELVVPRNLMNKLGISDWKLSSFGAISNLKIINESYMLTKLQEGKLLAEPYFYLDKSPRLANNLVFITGRYRGGDQLCMVEGQDSVYIFSITIFNGCGG